MRKVPLWRQFDYVLLGILLILVALGVAMIRSATLGTGEDLVNLWQRQGSHALIGMALFLVVAVFPYYWLRSIWWLGYLVAIGLLVLVLFVGESEVGDVNRWFYIGTFRFQPSFPAMILQVVAMAAVLDYRPRHELRVEAEEEKKDAPPGLLRYLLSALLMMVLAGLVFRQPDLSTAVTFPVIWIAVAFISGVRLAYLLGTAVLGIGALIPMWSIMEEYQRERLLLFLNPALDPEKLYTRDQALISIGSGGLWGQGYGVGSQSQLHFLRVRHTDFIFSVISEELGFIGIALLLLLYALLAWRLMRAILLAPDRFGKLLVVGAGAIIFFPLAINVGMNSALLPVTGLPLPFISYGGTALITSMTAMGLVEGVVMRRSPEG